MSSLITFFCFLIIFPLSSFSAEEYDYPVAPSIENRKYALDLLSKVDHGSRYNSIKRHINSSRFTRAALMSCYLVSRSYEPLYRGLLYVTQRFSSNPTEIFGNCLRQISNKSFSPLAVQLCRHDVGFKKKGNKNLYNNFSCFKSAVGKKVKISILKKKIEEIKPGSYWSGISFEGSDGEISKPKLNKYKTYNKIIISDSGGFLCHKIEERTELDFDQVKLKDCGRISYKKINGLIACVITEFKSLNDFVLNLKYCRGEKIPRELLGNSCEEKLDELKGIYAHRMGHRDKALQKWLKGFNKILTRTHKGIFIRKTIPCEKRLADLRNLISALSPEVSSYNREWGKVMSKIIRSPISSKAEVIKE